MSKRKLNHGMGGGGGGGTKMRCAGLPSSCSPLSVACYLYVSFAIETIVVAITATE